jgi:hypothetical protein
MKRTAAGAGPSCGGAATPCGPGRRGRPGVRDERLRRLGAGIAGPDVVADHGVELIDRRRAPEYGRTATGPAAVQKATNLTPLFISEPGRDPEINNRENILLAPRNRRSQHLERATRDYRIAGGRAVNVDGLRLCGSSFSKNVIGPVRRTARYEPGLLIDPGSVRGRHQGLRRLMRVPVDGARSALTCDGSDSATETGDHESGNDNPARGLGTNHSRRGFAAMFTVRPVGPHDHVP